MQESCLLAGEIDVAVTAAERENGRPLGLYLFINKPESSAAGAGYSVLPPKQSVNNQITPRGGGGDGDEKISSGGVVASD